MTRGLVTKSTGKFYTLKNLEDGSFCQAFIRGKFKLKGFKLTNPVAVGDIVAYTIGDDGQGWIQEIEDRTNYVVRQSPRKKHYLHLLASNVDQAVLIVTIAEPKLKQGFIDRFLLMTEPYNIPVTIVFNKADVYDEGHMNVFQYLKDLYEKIGYDVFLTSVVSGEGIDELKAQLERKTTLIAGQSGVGKSSIVNKLDSSVDIKTNIISDYSGKGQHTTTFAEMHFLADEGNIIDTPGIKTLSFNHLEAMDVAHNFREIFNYSKNCKFGDCKHRDEPACAVKKAIEEEEISELRYYNYVQILDEIENQNYWERIKNY